MQRPGECGALIKQQPGALGLETHQFAQTRGRDVTRPTGGGRSPQGRRRRCQIALAAPERRHVLLRQVHPALGEVLRHVLPVLGQLQRGAHQVGQALTFRRRGAEDTQDDAPDRIGGQLAVAEQVLEGRIPADRLVLPVGLDQHPERLRGNGAFGRDERELTDNGKRGRAHSGERTVEVLFDGVESAQPVIGFWCLVTGLARQATGGGAGGAGGSGGGGAGGAGGSGGGRWPGVPGVPAAGVPGVPAAEKPMPAGTAGSSPMSSTNRANRYTAIRRRR